MTSGNVNGEGNEGSSEAFRVQVEKLVSEGKLSADEAAELLAYGHETSGEQVAEQATGPDFAHQALGAASEEQTTSSLAQDLYAEVSGFSLIVSVDASLSAPVLGGQTEGVLLSRTASGWKVASESNQGLRLGTQRVTLNLPFTPQHVRAEVSGGQLVLPDIRGRAQVQVSGGNLRLRECQELSAEINGGNLNVAAVERSVRLKVNGGNAKIERASSVDAEINGGMLTWSGELRHGLHRLELNGGAAILNLAAGSSLNVRAEVTVGQLSANFPTVKRGGLLNASYTATLGQGEAGLSCEVAAGQVRLNAEEPSQTSAAGGEKHA